MNKNEQVQFLEGQLHDGIRLRLLGEVTVRNMKSLSLMDPAFERDNRADIRKTEAANAALNMKIKKYREVIEEVKNGKFIV